MDSWTDDVGNTVVYDTDFPKNLYWKPEGSDKFFTLRVEGFGGNANRHRLEGEYTASLKLDSFTQHKPVGFKNLFSQMEHCHGNE
jgi:hypothetical protein